jgi:Holliday junction DNA helicase RuvB
MNILRPERFNDLVGQEELLESLKIAVVSSNQRDAALNHCLFHGPPGLGKTTLANALANELNVDIQVANGANLRTVSKLLPLLWKMVANPARYRRSILFIDEIHRITNLVEEFLYPVMEDFRLDISVEGKKGQVGEVISEQLPEFTLVGATTEMGSLAAPFRDRFKLKFPLRLYDPEELVILLINNAKKLEVPIGQEGLTTIAKSSRGTPRIANGLLEWIRDYGIAKRVSRLSASHVERALALRGIGLDGSTENDRLYLDFLLKNGGGPVGVDSICSGINVDIETVKSTIEPWLIQHHKIIKTKGGRKLI